MRALRMVGVGDPGSSHCASDTAGPGARFLSRGSLMSDPAPWVHRTFRCVQSLATSVSPAIF